MTTKIKPARIDSTQDFAFANVTAVAITANTIVANGSIGANGNVLASNGSNIYWSNTAGGGVTSARVTGYNLMFGG